MSKPWSSMLVNRERANPERIARAVPEAAPGGATAGGNYCGAYRFGQARLAVGPLEGVAQPRCRDALVLRRTWHGRRALPE